MDKRWQKWRISMSMEHEANENNTNRHFCSHTASIVVHMVFEKLEKKGHAEIWRIDVWQSSMGNIIIQRWRQMFLYSHFITAATLKSHSDLCKHVYMS